MKQRNLFFLLLLSLALSLVSGDKVWANEDIIKKGQIVTGFKKNMKLFDSEKYRNFFVSSDVNKTLNALTDLAKYYKGGEKITKPIEGFQSEFINFLNYHNFVVQSVNLQYKE